ncbi:MAG: hypothetical protein HY664_06555 [Chloroflexi bacterium]|nr:hypothetical protein [Chloroflexota bacterium]
MHRIKGRWGGIACSLLLGVVLLAVPLTQACSKEGPGAVVIAPPWNGGFGYGMNVHVTQDNIPQVMAAVRGAGFNWAKQQIPWRDWEPAPGQYHWDLLDQMVDGAVGNEVNLLFSVVKAPDWARPKGTDLSVDGPPADFQVFGRSLAALVQRYKGKVKAYEIWNEQNLWYEWGGRGKRLSAQEYVRLLRIAYQSIKGVDPQAIVLSGGLTPTGVNDGDIAVDDVAYLEQMYKAGFASYVDAVGAHAGGYNNPPDDDPDHKSVTSTTYKGHWSFYFRRLEQLHDVMLRYGDDRKLWVTEFGWSTNNADPNYAYGADNSDEDQARYLVRAFQLGKEWGWVGVMFVWNLNFQSVVPATDEKYPFGILGPDWKPRPAYKALQRMPK